MLAGSCNTCSPNRNQHPGGCRAPLSLLDYTQQLGVLPNVTTASCKCTARPVIAGTLAPCRFLFNTLKFWDGCTTIPCSPPEPLLGIWVLYSAEMGHYLQVGPTMSAEDSLDAPRPSPATVLLVLLLQGSRGQVCLRGDTQAVTPMPSNHLQVKMPRVLYSSRMGQALQVGL